jgi:glyoxylase I family protein
VSSLNVGDVLAGLPVSDIKAAIDWFTRLLGRGSDAEPMEGLAEWDVARHQTVQLVLDPQRAGAGMVTLQVSDIAAARDALA